MQDGVGLLIHSVSFSSLMCCSLLLPIVEHSNPVHRTHAHDTSTLHATAHPRQEQRMSACMACYRMDPNEKGWENAEDGGMRRPLLARRECPTAWGADRATLLARRDRDALLLGPLRRSLALLSVVVPLLRSVIARVNTSPPPPLTARPLAWLLCFFATTELFPLKRNRYVGGLSPHRDTPAVPT